MWEIQYIVDCDCFKFLTLQETWKTQNQLQEDSMHLWRSYIFPEVGYVTSKLRSHTVRQSLKFVSLHAGSRMDAVPVLDLLDSVINVLHFPMNGALGNWLPNKQTKTYIKRDGLELIHVDDVSANAQSCRSGTMIYIHKIRKHELRRSSKEVQWWDTCPSPTKLHMIGCLTGSTWTRRSRSNTSTPNTNSQTYWQTEISHVMNVTIFSVRFQHQQSQLSLLFWDKLPNISVEEITGRRRTKGKSDGQVKANDYCGVDGKIPTNDVLESLCKLRKRIWSTQTVLGVVRNGDSSEGFEGEENSRSKVQVT